MYLSRLLLSSRSPDVRRDLRNVHDMHRRVLTAFPDREIQDGARRAYGTLYRLETSPRGDVSLLVQSETEPNWSRLPDGYLLDCFEPNPATTELGPLLARLRPGQRLRFRLRANATKRLRGTDGKRGPRVELFGNERLLAWLVRKAQGAGFSLPLRDGVEPGADGHSPPAAERSCEDIHRYRVRVTEEPKVYGGRGGARLTFGSTLFEGELVVDDPAVFATTLKRGLGSAKAYGFGLLSVAPA